MSNLPIISIITPCYNHEKFIRKTIESILNQGYEKLQYIVINDCSTDSSGQIINEYKDKLEIITISEYNTSATISMNKIMSKIQGEIMTWISSDDILLENSLYTIADFFNSNKEINWVSGYSTTIDANSNFINCKLRPKNKFDYASTKHWSVIQQESTFFRVNFFKKVGMYLDWSPQAYDTELWTRMFTVSDLVYIDSQIGAFRKSNQSKSTRNKKEFSFYNNNFISNYRKKIIRKNKFDLIIYEILMIKFIKKILSFIPSKFISYFFIRKYLVKMYYKDNVGNWNYYYINRFKY
jgi:alpha-1,3-rhamnosyltransferase